MSTRHEPARTTGDSQELLRRQLDARLQKLPAVPTPTGGWIRTIRLALGMTMKQLGHRMGVTPQAVRDLESREVLESISIAKLRAAAAAMHCDLRIVLVPRPALEETVRTQAMHKAREERDRLMHTMGLEAQESGVHDVLDVEQAAERWRTERAGRLWD